MNCRFPKCLQGPRERLRRADGRSSEPPPGKVAGVCPWPLQLRVKWSTAMRLTLRSMLAYMAGILDPEDAEEIGAKIRENEYATKLLHRTRDVMRRLRVGAPPLGQKGAKGFDPNTVAEYLDHVLPPDRVADFEKVCLESDIHLAEVASCHQILTMVLGEPAEVDPASREKMYRLPQVAAARRAAKAGEPEAAGKRREAEPATGRKQPESRAQPQVPEYLRAERRKWSPVASVATAVVFLLLAGYILLVVTGNGGVVSQLLGFAPPEPAAVSRADSPAPAATDAGQTEQSVEKGEAPDRPAETTPSQPTGPSAAAQGGAEAQPEEKISQPATGRREEPALETAEAEARPADTAREVP